MQLPRESRCESAGRSVPRSKPGSRVERRRRRAAGDCGIGQREGRSVRTGIPREPFNWHEREEDIRGVGGEEPRCQQVADAARTLFLVRVPVVSRGTGEHQAERQPSQHTRPTFHEPAHASPVPNTHCRPIQSALYGNGITRDWASARVWSVPTTSSGAGGFACDSRSFDSSPKKPQRRHQENALTEESTGAWPLQTAQAESVSGENRLTSTCQIPTVSALGCARRVPVRQPASVQVVSVNINRM